jgi:hypothetical protein
MWTGRRNRSPSQSCELCVVAVFGNPFASVLNRESREPGILYQISRGIRFSAQVAKDLPVFRARMDDTAVRLVKKGCGEREDRTEAVRIPERSRVCCNPDHR